jgi:hypothetical protein
MIQEPWRRCRDAVKLGAKTAYRLLDETIDEYSKDRAEMVAAGLAFYTLPFATAHPISYVSLSDTKASSPFAVISASGSTTATWCPGSTARQTTRSEPLLGLIG